MNALYSDMEIDRLHAGRPDVVERDAWTAYLDIETATQPDRLVRAAVSSGDLAALEEVDEGARSPLGGRVIAWAIAEASGLIHCRVSASITDERETLLALLEALGGVGQVFAWNGSGFDFPFLRARALACGVPELARLLSGRRLVDPSAPDWCPRPPGPGGMRGWTLDAVAELLGIPRPRTTPGRDIPAAWYDGRHTEVLDHVVDDVRTLRLVAQRLAEGRP